MNIKCPHCGTEYEIGKSEYGRYVKCEICGKGFVAGTFTAKKPDKTANSANDNVANALDTVFEQTKKIDWQAHKERVKTASSMASKKVGEYFRERTEKNLAKNPKMAQFIRMLASSPWTVQFSTVYLLMFGLTFAFCILLRSKLSSSFIPALMTLAIALTISFTLVRSNFVRWMLILWGVFNLILLVFGSSDFRWLWPFNAGFATLAILLILKMTNQWYKNGPALNVSADIMAYQQVAVFAAILAVIANVIIYVGYSSVRKQMRLSRSRDLSYDAPASSSHSSKYASPSQTSAEAAIAGALANVKSRYRAKLDHYGLTESYFDETSGICDLMLLDVQSWTKYQIVYYRASDEISWPRTMPKGVAKDLMQDRLLIQKYECSLGKSKPEARKVNNKKSEEEERIEQEARREYARPLFSALSFDEKPYLYIQKRLVLSVVSAKVTDRRWKMLSAAQAKKDWLEMMNIISDREGDARFSKYPDKKEIASLYNAILDHKWNIEVCLENVGVRTPVPGDCFREIAHSIKIGRKEREIVARHSKEDYERYKKFQRAMAKMKDDGKPYPIDIEVCVAKMKRDGDIENIHWCQPNGPRRCEGGNTVNFQFSMGEGATYLLYVDDKWYWKQHVSDSLRAKMSKYLNLRNKYYSEIVKLADAVEHQQYGKREALAKRKAITDKYHESFLNAVADFMGLKSIALPPLPTLLNDGEDDNDLEMEVAMINVSQPNYNRFDESEREMLEMEELERMSN